MTRPGAGSSTPSSRSNATRYLITGGCGFIGSNFIRCLLANRRDASVTNFDALTYAGNRDNLLDVEGDDRYAFERADIADAEAVGRVMAKGFDVVVNFAAESHVDRSLYDPARFVRTNVLGAQNLLEAARSQGVPRFVQISTDEVYGSLGPEGKFTETTPLAPSSPYSATKAAGDLLALAFFKTFGFPVIVTRSSNNYGPYQFPEKLIPLCISNAMEGKNLPVYGDGMNVRDWLFVEDNCEAILAIAEKGRVGEVYNVGGGCEVPNIELIKAMLREMNKPESLITFVTDRPGHDRRYALDSSKLTRELGWSPRVGISEGLRRTVEWFSQNRGWLERVRSGAYRDFYEQHYGRKL
ncbi:MAG: dTDP-glucose 4,6-dehydratase [Planctomycetota bacterium]|nr:dTDP-glucose 4,6-dehydratase [Planctomycetota bacterium]